MVEFSQRFLADIRLMAIRLASVAALVFFSFFVSLLLLSLSLNSMRSGSYSTLPPADTYLLETALVATDGNGQDQMQGPSVLGDYLVAHPEVQLHVPLHQVARAEPSSSGSAGPPLEGVLIVTQGQLKNSSGEVLLQAPPHGSLALAGSLEDLTGSSEPYLANGIPLVQAPEKNTNMVIVRADGWQKDYSEGAVLLGGPDILARASIPADITFSQQRLLCLCSADEAERAAQSLVEVLGDSGYQVLVSARDPVAAMPVTARLSAAQELLVSFVPLGLALATGSALHIFIVRINRLRADAFAVERLNGGRVVAQLLRINLLVLLAVVVPALCATELWGLLSLARGVENWLKAPLLLALMMYVHPLATLSFYINYRKVGY